LPSPPPGAHLSALVLSNVTMPTHQLIREHMRSFVQETMLLEGFENEDAVIDHWQAHPALAHPDAIVSEQDIANYRAAAAEALWRLAADDAESVELWVAGHEEQVIFYQRQKKEINQPFILVFATQDMLDMMQKNGNLGTVHLDDTFGECSPGEPPRVCPRAASRTLSESPHSLPETLLRRRSRLLEQG
jgi:hypothetical protein